eukprot:TRINITY_DN40533_c0_g1_i1.p1 TRINITY_DN40533_c0_g1~~TRINITY_DN40533_c0_g1_i1.p1  ORF type:complete len:1029 (+),score=174.14 TRINITY_DN40533_c0_g1_i1:195-3089(+)
MPAFRELLGLLAETHDHEVIGLRTRIARLEREREAVNCGLPSSMKEAHTSNLACSPSQSTNANEASNPVSYAGSSSVQTVNAGECTKHSSFENDSGCRDISEVELREVCHFSAVPPPVAAPWPPRLTSAVSPLPADALILPVCTSGGIAKPGRSKVQSDASEEGDAVDLPVATEFAKRTVAAASGARTVFTGRRAPAQLLNKHFAVPLSDHDEEWPKVAEAAQPSPNATPAKMVLQELPKVAEAARPPSRNATPAEMVCQDPTSHIETMSTDVDVNLETNKGCSDEDDAVSMKSTPLDLWASFIHSVKEKVGEHQEDFMVIERSWNVKSFRMDEEAELSSLIKSLSSADLITREDSLKPDEFAFSFGALRRRAEEHGDERTCYGLIARCLGLVVRFLDFVIGLVAWAFAGLTTGKAIHPNSKLRMSWDLIGVLLIFHDLIMIPMNTFPLPIGYIEFQREFDVWSATFWTVDVGVSFVTGYFSSEGFVVLQRSKVAANYFRTWLVLDLFVVSVDWSTMAIGFSGATGYLRMGKTASRFLRIIRLLRFLKLSSLFEELMMRVNSEYILTVTGLIKSLLFMVIMNHYLACCWYALSTALDDSGHRAWTQKAFGVITEDMSPNTRLLYYYSTSLHWSLTQFTPASMEVTPCNAYERFFNVVVILVALVIFSSFVSSITTAMTHIRNINAAKTAREAAIRSYFAENSISAALASRVWHYMGKNKCVGTRRLREADIPSLGALPQEILDQLHEEVRMPVICVHPFFQYYSQLDKISSLKLTTQAVREASLKPLERYAHWEDPQDMVFVVHGQLEYHPESNHSRHSRQTPIEEVLPGGWACEATLWCSNPRLEGPLVAWLQTNCMVLLVAADKAREIVQAHSTTKRFAKRYAELFVQLFNRELLADPSGPIEEALFNSPERIQDLVKSVEFSLMPRRRASAKIWEVGAAMRGSIRQSMPKLFGSLYSAAQD